MVAVSQGAVNPDEAVALGAALQASVLQGGVKDMMVIGQWQVGDSTGRLSKSEGHDWSVGVVDGSELQFYSGRWDCLPLLGPKSSPRSERWMMGGWRV